MERGYPHAVELHGASAAVLALTPQHWRTLSTGAIEKSDERAVAAITRGIYAVERGGLVINVLAQDAEGHIHTLIAVRNTTQGLVGGFKPVASPRNTPPTPNHRPRTTLQPSSRTWIRWLRWPTNRRR